MRTRIMSGTANTPPSLYKRQKQRQADAVNIQRLRNDDMVHTRFAEVAALGQITHAAKATRLFIYPTANFQRTIK